MPLSARKRPTMPLPAEVASSLVLDLDGAVPKTSQKQPVSHPGDLEAMTALGPERDREYVTRFDVVLRSLRLAVQHVGLVRKPTNENRLCPAPRFSVHLVCEGSLL